MPLGRGLNGRSLRQELPPSFPSPWSRPYFEGVTLFKIMGHPKASAPESSGWGSSLRESSVRLVSERPLPRAGSGPLELRASEGVRLRAPLPSAASGRKTAWGFETLLVEVPASNLRLGMVGADAPV